MSGSFPFETSSISPQLHFTPPPAPAPLFTAVNSPSLRSQRRGISTDSNGTQQQNVVQSKSQTEARWPPSSRACMCTSLSSIMDPCDIFEDAGGRDRSYLKRLADGPVYLVDRSRRLSSFSTRRTDSLPFSRQGFGKGTTKSNQNLKASYNNGAQSPSSQQPPMPPLVHSPSIGSTYSQDTPYNEHESKKFLNEKHAKCSVKGNFLTLAAQPKNVDLGEWLAHQRKLFAYAGRCC